jgi:hypothetical protein
LPRPFRILHKERKQGKVVLSLAEGGGLLHNQARHLIFGAFG